MHLAKTSLHPRREYSLKRVGSPLGPVDPSFRALSRRLQFTARRHTFNKDSRYRQVKALRDKGVKASALFGTLGKKARNAVMNDLMGRAYTDGAEGPYLAPTTCGGAVCVFEKYNGLGACLVHTF